MDPAEAPRSHPPSTGSNSPSASDEQTPPQPTLKQRAQIKTHHCRFCSHLLLATTQDLGSLARRREPAGDRAMILPLPLPEDEDEDEDDEESEDESDDDEGDGEGEVKKKEREKQGERGDDDEEHAQHRKHYTILLSTTLPDRRHTVIRREDGFEKRLLLRCGRCRVVVGYVLDEEAHRAGLQSSKKDAGGGSGDGEEKKGKEKEKEREGRAKVVYILPGALVGTEEMGGDGEVKVEAAEWAKWIKR